MPKLIVKSGPNKGMVFDLSEESVTIGRDYSNAVQLPYQSVSRRHARLSREGDGWVVSDLDSRNGTRVNGKTVKRQPLNPLDEIGVGDVVLSFVADRSDDSALPATDERADAIAVTQELKADALAHLRLGIESKSPQEAHEANTRLRALLELSSAATSTRSLQELFDKAAKTVRSVLQPDRLVPILYNAASDQLTPWNIEKSTFDKRFARIPISTTIVNHVKAKRVAVLSQGTTQDDRFRGSPSILSHAVGTALCVPIQIGDHLLGMVYADRLGKAENFTKADLEFLAAAALQLAVAIETIKFCEDMSSEKLTLQRELRGQYNLIGESAPMKAVFDFVSKAAPTEACVLISGESGTGKELVARAIHYNSPRGSKPLEIVNCAALTSTLLESELFGHVKGAFTGSLADKPGRFELAHGGSIFLDEIGELPDASQSRFLRVLEDGSLRRVGDVKDRKVDVRVIAATNKNLEDEVRKGRFREDLYYRLNVLKIALPPLRERPGDVDLLANHFLGHFAAKCAKTLTGFTPDAMKALAAYRWPGNVRELKNAVERMVIMASGNVLDAPDLPYEVRTGQARRADEPTSDLCSLADLEKAHVAKVLAHAGGNKKRAAELLGIDRTTLYAKLKAYGIKTDEG